MSKEMDSLKAENKSLKTSLTVTQKKLEIIEREFEWVLQKSEKCVNYLAKLNMLISNSSYCVEKKFEDHKNTSHTKDKIKD